MAKKPNDGLSWRHKIGYGLGDAGGCMTFALMGSTFAMYCTDALKIDTTLMFWLLIRRQRRHSVTRAVRCCVNPAQSR